MKICVYTKACTSLFIVALFAVAETWKQPRYPSTGEWIHGSVFMQTPLSNRKERTTPTCINLHESQKLYAQSLPQNSTYCRIPFYEILEQAYLIYGGRRSEWLSLGVGVEITWEGPWRTFWVVMLFVCNTGEYSCQNPSDLRVSP